MIDLLTIALTHMLMLIAAWRLLWRADLDKEEQPEGQSNARPWLEGRDTKEKASKADA